METKIVKNSALSAGSVVITRSDRGTILATHVVQEITRGCTDPSNLHVSARDRKHNANVAWCMFDNAESEVQDNG